MICLIFRGSRRKKLGGGGNIAPAEFDLQLPVAQRVGVGEVSRAVVAERRGIPWEINPKASLDLQREKKAGSV